MHALAITLFAIIFSLSLGLIGFWLKQDFAKMRDALLGKPRVRVSSLPTPPAPYRVSARPNASDRARRISFPAREVALPLAA